MNQQNQHESKVKDYGSTLERINHIPVKSKDQKEYTEGYLLVSGGALAAIKGFLGEDNLCKDYPSRLREMRSDYHKKYLLLKKAEKGAFNDGQYRAARDVHKGLDTLIESIAHDELQKLEKRQQTPQRRR